MNKHQIYVLGLALGLSHNKLENMQDSWRFLDDVIIAWLRREDQVGIIHDCTACHSVILHVNIS